MRVFVLIPSVAREPYDLEDFKGSPHRKLRPQNLLFPKDRRGYRVPSLRSGLKQKDNFSRRTTSRNSMTCRLDGQARQL
jgi:hypothetical protein